MVLRNKKAAMEMSLGTIITIVLSVVFLILALVVLRNMYGFQTESVGSIQEKTLKKINDLYLGDEDINTRINIQLGSDKLAKVRAGNPNFGIGVVAVTRANTPIQNGTDLQFEFRLDESSPTNCVKLNTLTVTKTMFSTPLNTWVDSKYYYDSSGGVTISLSVPSTMRLCNQEVYVRARDRTVNPEGEILGQDVFTIQILRKNPFG